MRFGRILFGGAIGLGVALVLPTSTPVADDVQINCSVVIPDQPLTSAGLATPWQLKGGSSCHQSSPHSALFVEALVLDPGSGNITAYRPLVVDHGSQPAIQSSPVAVPDSSVVGIWATFHGDSLKLESKGQQNCLEASPKAVFCNVGAFYQAANQAISAGKLKVPSPGQTSGGKPCLTIRDFSVVGEEDWASTTASYLVTQDGKTAPDTPSNRAMLPAATVLSDQGADGLLVNSLDPAQGCHSWQVQDLADPMMRESAGALDQLQAAAYSPSPAALLPSSTPEIREGGTANLATLKALRAALNEPSVDSLEQADPKAYCNNLLTAGLPRIIGDQQQLSSADSPVPSQADNLFHYLAGRWQNTYLELGCEQQLNMKSPLQLSRSSAGVVVDAQADLGAKPPTASPAPSPSPTPSPQPADQPAASTPVGVSLAPRPISNPAPPASSGGGSSNSGNNGGGGQPSSPPPPQPTNVSSGGDFSGWSTLDNGNCRSAGVGEWQVCNTQWTPKM